MINTNSGHQGYQCKQHHRHIYHHSAAAVAAAATVAAVFAAAAAASVAVAAVASTVAFRSQAMATPPPMWCALQLVCPNCNHGLCFFADVELLLGCIFPFLHTVRLWFFERLIN